MTKRKTRPQPQPQSEQVCDYQNEDGTVCGIDVPVLVFYGEMRVCRCENHPLSREERPRIRLSENVKQILRNALIRYEATLKAQAEASDTLDK